MRRGAAIVLAALAIVGLSVHVGIELTVAFDPSRPSRPRLSFLPLALSTCSAVASAGALVGDGRLARTLLGHRVTHALLLASLAYAADVFPTFALAYTTILWVFLCVHVLHVRGYARYDPTPHEYVAIRSATYAFVRSAFELLVRNVPSVPPDAVRLVPLGLSLAENVLTCRLRSYTFDVASAEFWAYTALKTSLFTLLPWIEAFALRTGGGATCAP